MKNSLLIIAVILFSCNPAKNPKGEMDKLEKAKVISIFRASSDMNDSYFSLKEGNYFEFYKSLYDSVKNTVYGGTYTMNLDTIKLEFFNTEGEKIFGNRAVIDKAKNEIYFFNASNDAKRMRLFN